MDEIRCIGVVGTGTIGASWAAYFLARGFDVSATDPMPGAEAKLREAVRAHWPILTRMGLAAGALPERLRFSSSLAEALQGVHFVQESGPEREDLKLALFREMDVLLPPDVILASSSSGLLMSKVQGACTHPERVVLGHPFNPPHMIPLVEVLGGALTSPETVERTMAFYAAIGKRPILVRKEVPGHIANRLQAALWREAFHLVEQGVATVADVDTAIAYGPGLRWALMGPFLNMHLGGGEGGIRHMLDHLGAPIESWWDDLGTPRITEELKQQLTEGVAAALEGRDGAALAPARDALLAGLIDAKKNTDKLP
ncbi:3-hydroxyacyl-CoA dehydrogenase NAD-binding domain-containing protein [Massilia sp. Mn16-1_5]|uniref:3-hydroxyacyl-CoA dehydrogenase NAD-binding domain-containing protein n=1 Tax=Massilia sp. Mn16-1_5 TaxID=2079199 RepID=UPI00109E8B2C|nr:3-hydroxyacyl-CoA dehydrogenase NAD-binding domain-containing protein [Massilia sp. Mn16-1_5]THC46691.1 3-hydroxyacyl-CoA dehydrogenase [Massilia sp. Mn16-1_5]